MQSVNGVMIKDGSLIDTHAASNSRSVQNVLSDATFQPETKRRERAQENLSVERSSLF